MGLLLLLLLALVGLGTGNHGPASAPGAPAHGGGTVPIVLRTDSAGGPTQEAVKRWSYVPRAVTYVRAGGRVAIEVGRSYQLRRMLLVRSWRCRSSVVMKVVLPGGRKWWRIPQLSKYGKVYEVDVVAGRLRGVLGVQVGEGLD